MSKVKIGEITDSCLGKMLDAAKNKGEYAPYLANANVRWGSFDLSDLPLMRFEAHEQDRYGLKYGDLVMCEGGEPVRCAIWRDEIPDMKIQKALHRIRPHDGVDAYWLYYWFLACGQRHLLDRFFIETTIKHLPGDRLKEIELDLPPYEEQKNIGAVLSSLDEKINLNKRICTELEAMAKTLYDYWFVQYDFPDENDKPYRTSGGAMEWCQELGREVPKGWKAGTIANLGEIVSGATPSTANEGYYTSDGIAWITPNDLSSNEHNMFIFHGERDITEAGLNSCSSVLMPAGSVLMSSRAPIGYLAIAANPVCTNQGFKSIICNKDFGTLFVYYTLKSNVQGIARQGVGTTFKEVSRDTLARYSILLPKTDIAVQFEQTITPIAQARKKCERENRELTALRDWLLPMLMNGQAKVGKEDEQ